MIPFLESADGNCQDAVILVEDVLDTVKLLGAFEGTAIEQIKIAHIQNCKYYETFFNKDMYITTVELRL